MVCEVKSSVAPKCELVEAIMKVLPRRMEKEKRGEAEEVGGVYLKR